MPVQCCGSDREVVAWGFRNVFGAGFGPGGELYVSQNGSDMRGLRPAEHDKDAFFRVREGEWYGWPDYTAELNPFTTMSPPERMLAAGREKLEFVIDHDASGLDASARDLLVATFHHHSELRSSTSHRRPGSGAQETHTLHSYGSLGRALERPIEVKFGADGAMYVLDFGVGAH